MSREGTIEWHKEKLAEAEKELAVLKANAVLMANIEDTSKAHEEAKAKAEAAYAHSNEVVLEASVRLGVIVPGGHERQFTPEFRAAVVKAAGITVEEAAKVCGSKYAAPGRAFDDACEAEATRLRYADEAVKRAHTETADAERTATLIWSHANNMKEPVSKAERHIESHQKDIARLEAERSKRQATEAAKAVPDSASAEAVQTRKAEKALKEVREGKRKVEWPPEGKAA